MHKSYLLLIAALFGLALPGCKPAAKSCVPDEEFDIPGPVPTPAETLDIPALPSDLTAQLLFIGAEGVSVEWVRAESGARPAAVSLRIPGRVNVDQAHIHRFKLSTIPKRENLELFATLELGTFTPRSEAHLDRNAIAVPIHDQDIASAASGTPIAKVIYLAGQGIWDSQTETQKVLSSGDCPPEVDLVKEAEKAGQVLAILRIEGQSK